MFERVLRRIREKIRKREYVMTLHAGEEMEADDLTVYDVERGILTGIILEGQRDRATAERKYRIRGRTLGEGDIEVIVKMGPTGKLVVITVYIP